MSASRRPAATPEATREPASAAGRQAAKCTALALDLAAILLIGSALALSVRGYFLRPHEDFFELLETGQTLLRGELPPSLKRAPLYPLVVAAGGALLEAAAPGEIPAPQRFAEWLNALLLPINGVLVYFVARRWTAGAARWVAFAFLPLPWGLYCSAHLLLEPLLATMLLLTLLAVGRRPGLACAFAAAATLTRFDAAGVLAGIVLCDYLRGEPTNRIIARGFAAATLPALWLVLTALTWDDRADDHYLRQMIERPGFDLRWSTQVVVDACFSPQRIALPAWVDMDQTWMRRAARGFLALSGLIGASVLLLRREPAAITGAVAYFAYLVAHAAFPFQFERFGYPLAPLLLASAAAGLSASWSVASRSAWERAVRAGFVTFAALAAAALIWGELAAWRAARASVDLRAPWLLAVFAFALALMVMAAIRAGPRRFAQGLAALLVAASGLVHWRESAELLGARATRDELLNAARWVAARLRPEDAVVSDVAGLLRLYSPQHDRGRLLTFGQLRGESLAEALVDCRVRGVRYLIWHERIFDFHGVYYADRWRLHRFAALDEPDRIPGLRTVWRGEGVRVLELGD